MTYNPRKAAQSIAFFILKNDRERLNILKVTKLIYLSDRESLKTYGFPIQDEKRVSMRKGPLNSDTYDYIKGKYTDEGWSAFLSEKIAYSIGLATHAITEDKLDELSEADIEVMNRVWDTFGQMKPSELVSWTHDKNNVPEWEDPNKSSKPIPLLEMMKAVGVKDAEYQVELIEECNRFEKLFERL